MKVTRKYLDSLVRDLTALTGKPHYLDYASHYGGYMLYELTDKRSPRKVWGRCSSQKMEAYLIGRLWAAQEKRIEADLATL